MRPVVLAVFVVAAMSACGDSPIQTGIVTTVEITGGATQGTVHEVLATPIVVRVTDGHRPVPGIQVQVIPRLGGNFSGASSSTDGRGEVKGTWGLGDTAGDQVLYVKVTDVRGDGAVIEDSIHVTAVAGPVDSLLVSFQRILLFGERAAIKSLVTGARDEFGNVTLVPAIMAVADPAYWTVTTDSIGPKNIERQSVVTLSSGSASSKMFVVGQQSLTTSQWRLTWICHSGPGEASSDSIKRVMVTDSVRYSQSPLFPLFYGTVTKTTFQPSSATTTSAKSTIIVIAQLPDTLQIQGSSGLAGNALKIASSPRAYRGGTLCALTTDAAKWPLAVDEMG